MTFKAQIINHTTLKNAFESIRLIVDEITLIANNKGLHLRCLDKSHITFIVMDLDKNFFDEWECEDPEKIHLDVDVFYNILKKAKKEDILELSLNEGNLIIELKGDATRRFEIGLIDLEYENPQPPYIDFPCTINIPSGLLKEYVDDMEMFSEKLEFIVDEDYLRICADGQKGNAETKYIHGENINEVVRSSFSIPKLKEIFKASKFSRECSISLGTDNPIKVAFKLVTNDGELSYLLAPRLNEE